MDLIDKNDKALSKHCRKQCTEVMVGRSALRYKNQNLGLGLFLYLNCNELRS